MFEWKKKKISAVIAAFIVSLLPVISHAEGLTSKVIISTDKPNYSVGDTITTSFSVDGNMEPFGIQFTINYDPSAVYPVVQKTYKSEEVNYAVLDETFEKSFSSQINKSLENIINGTMSYGIIYMSSETAPTNSKVVSVSFKALKEGSAAFSLSNIKVVDREQHSIEPTNISTTIQINKPQNVAVHSVTLDKHSGSLLVGETQQLNATVNPENATNKAVKWSSSDTSVAPVDSNGKVTALKAGSAIIKVETLDGAFTDSFVASVLVQGNNNGGNNNGNGGNNSSSNGNGGSSEHVVINDPVKVVEAVKATPANQVTAVDASTNKKVDKSIFEAIKGTDKTVSFTTGNTVWTFNGKDITNAKDIDLTVNIATLENSTSPNKGAIAEKVKNEDVLILSFADNGILPGQAKVKVKLDAAWLAGKDTNNIYIYYYNPSTKKAESVAKQLKVDKDGYIEFEVTHNSDFFAADKDLVRAEVLPKTGSVIDATVLVTAGLITIAIGVLFTVAGRRKSEFED